MIYDPVILGLIIKVSPSLLPLVKNELIFAASKLLIGDKGCVYNKDLKITKVGETVADIANYANEEFDLSSAIIKIVNLLAKEDSDSKYIVIVLDDYSEKNRIKTALQIDLNNNYGCCFLFCTIKYKYDELKDFEAIHPRCKYLHFGTTDGLGNTILSVYKE